MIPLSIGNEHSVVDVVNRQGVWMLQELARLAFAWGAMVGIVWFWYWLLGNIGTF